jgi:pyrroline-5-carboxylate reductase
MHTPFTPRVAILGAGNLGQCIARGLLDKASFPAAHLTLTRTRPEMLSSFAEEGIRITSNNALAAAEADIIFIAVKPFKVEEVLRQIAPSLQPGQLLVSMATGIHLDQLATWCGHQVVVCRAMPNTASAIGESATCLAWQASDVASVQPVIRLFEQIGLVVEVPEELMNSATVLGACGIAFALRFIRAMVQGGIEIGFDAHTAALIANQTVRGAASLLLRDNGHPEPEIDKVTTPKGCTIAGLNEMEHRGFSSSLIKGITTSYRKIEP